MTKHSLNLPYLVLSSAVLTAITAGVLFIRPVILTTTEQRGQMADKQEQLDQRQEFVRTIDRKKAQLQVNASRESELARELPTTEALEDVLRLIGQFADQTEVVVKTISNDSKASAATHRAVTTRGEDTGLPPGIIPLQIRLTLAGTYAQTRSMIDRLERSPRLLDVEQFSLKAIKDKPDQIDTELQIRLYMYELPKTSEL